MNINCRMHFSEPRLCAKCMKGDSERKNRCMKNTTGQGRENMVYMYTIMQEHKYTATPPGSQTPRKGDRHAGNIRQDQSAGRE